MNIKMSLNKMWAATKKAAPVIFGIAGAVGTVAVAVVAAKDGVKAHKDLESARKEKGEDLTKKETLCVAAPNYIRTGIVTGVTVACEITSVVLGDKQRKALIAPAAAMVGKWLDGKRNEKAAGKIDYDIPEKKVDPYEAIIVHDPATDQWFESTWFEVVSAEAFINHGFNCGGYTEGCIYSLSYKDLLDQFSDETLNSFALMGDGSSTEEYGWTIDYILHEWEGTWLGIGLDNRVMDDGTEYYELLTGLEPLKFEELSEMELD